MRAGLVGEDVEGDNGEDAAGEQSGGGDEEESRVGAERGEGVERELPEAWVVAPRAECEDGTEDESDQGECDEEELEADELACGEPIDDVARGLGGLVGGGLNVAEEEGEHEE